MLIEQKEEAIRLRQIERLSGAKIASIIGVAKSTVSLWVREFPLTKEEVGSCKAAPTPPELETICTICGKVFKTYRSHAKFCSKKCRRRGDTGRNQRIINATKKKRKKLKELSIEYKGGKCVICGYNRCHRALKFHHIDPAVKDFEVSRAGKSWASIKSELDKCILVCGNCHDEIHAGVTEIPEHLRSSVAAFIAGVG